jgi:hypothetical protein
LQSAAPQTADQYAAGTNAANVRAGAVVSTPDTNTAAQGYNNYNNDGCSPPAAQSAANDDPYLIPGNAPLIVRPAAAQYAVASPEEVPAPDQETRYYYHGRHSRHHHRSLKKSLAIVGGTAGVGAAIGGIAAGGRGAALGAVTGGAAGFLYDRLTH